MIPEINKILYATDLSENARYAFGYAASIANRFEARITILHVFEELSHNATIRLATMLGEGKWQELQDRNIHDVLDTIRTRLERFCQDADEELKECPYLVDDVIIKQGEPVEIILSQAEETGCDLVVMGTHGHGLLADAMMGSTATRVVRRSQLPVLIVRLPKA
jgi:nucleotide-binding universal stress UspA family protein